MMTQLLARRLPRVPLRPLLLARSWHTAPVLARACVAAGARRGGLMVAVAAGAASGGVGGGVALADGDDKAKSGLPSASLRRSLRPRRAARRSRAERSAMMVVVGWRQA